MGDRSQSTEEASRAFNTKAPFLGGRGAIKVGTVLSQQCALPKAKKTKVTIYQVLFVFLVLQ